MERRKLAKAPPLPPSSPTTSPLLSLLPTQSSSHFRSQYTGKKQPITETGSLLDSYSYINSCCLKQNPPPSSTQPTASPIFSTVFSRTSVIASPWGSRANTCQGPRQERVQLKWNAAWPHAVQHWLVTLGRFKVRLDWRKRCPTPAKEWQLKMWWAIVSTTAADRGEEFMFCIWTGRRLPVYTLNNLSSQAARLRDWISISLIFPVLVYLFHYTHSLISILAEREERERQGGSERSFSVSPPLFLPFTCKKKQGKKSLFFWRDASVVFYLLTPPFRVQWTLQEKRFGYHVEERFSSRTVCVNK